MLLTYFFIFLSQAACDVFCVGDDVNIEKANDSLISNDRSWKKSKFRMTYTAEAPTLTQGTSSSFHSSRNDSSCQKANKLLSN